jgi:hypothetical protein
MAKQRRAHGCLKAAVQLRSGVVRLIHTGWQPGFLSHGRVWAVGRPVVPGKFVVVGVGRGVARMSKGEGPGFLPLGEWGQAGARGEVSYSSPSSDGETAMRPRAIRSCAYSRLTSLWP